MRLTRYSIIFLSLLSISCAINNKNSQINTSQQSAEQLPYLTFRAAKLFPGDSSLLRPEDGVALPDGRVIVADQAKGLRLIQKDGSKRPFGRFTDVGFIENSPENLAAPNGLFLEHDNRHLLTCDIRSGKIYRINVTSESVELIYDHPFGVNAIYRDKTGAIWFTQSGTNARLVSSPVPTGAIFRLADMKSIPTTIADSFHLANGITMDQDEKTLFVAETMMNRVHSFDVDVTSGKTTPNTGASMRR